MSTDDRRDIQSVHEWVHQDILDVKPMALRTLMDRSTTEGLLKDYAQGVIYLAAHKAQEKAPEPDNDPISWRPETEGEKEQAKWEQAIALLAETIGNRIDRALHRD